MAEGIGEHQLSSTLGIEDLNTVLSKLSLLPKGKWKSFGLKAGLYDPTLSIIEANYPRDVEGCFRECVSYWLKRRDGVDKEGIPTWLRLGDILEEMGEKALAVKIMKQGTCTSTFLTKCGSTSTTKPVYIVPYELSFEYSKMNDRFSFVLSKFADEIIEGKLLEDLKAFLLGRSPNQSREEEIINVHDKLGLVSILRKYFFLSNFGSLMFFAEEYKFVASQTLSNFSKEIDDLYRKILAENFAQQAIVDHEKMEYHGEVIFKVVWSLNSSLKEFQDFLADAFHRHGILISLRVVHHSLLTFVCTIPKWLVAEMMKNVIKNKDILMSKKVVELIIEGIVIFSVKSKANETKEKISGKLKYMTLSDHSSVGLPAKEGKPYEYIKKQKQFEAVQLLFSLGPSSVTYSSEEVKHVHSLDHLKKELVSVSRYFIHELRNAVSLYFNDYFMEFISTNLEDKEFMEKVSFHRNDPYDMFCGIIHKCQSYSEIRKWCNLFLKAIGYAYIYHHDVANCFMLHSIAQLLKEEWEQELEVEPLVDVDNIFMFDF